MNFIGDEPSIESEGLFPRMLGNSASASSIFHGGPVTGSGRTLTSDPIVSTLNQPYGSEIPHYGPIYYSNYSGSLKTGNRPVPYSRRTDPYNNVYQNLYRPTTVPNSYDTR